jgi:hypothetical protein
VVSLFSRLDKNRPTTTTTELEKAEQPLKNLELLLDWLLNRWPKELITLRDIQAYGPGPVRDKKVAPNLMRILAARGWVTTVKPHRYDMMRWKIVRGSTFQPQAQPQPTIQLQP